MRVSKEQASENRERILKAASRLLRERGISGVGVDAHHALLDVQPLLLGVPLAAPGPVDEVDAAVAGSAPFGAQAGRRAFY